MATVCLTPGIWRATLFDASHGVLGAAERSRVRQLQVDQQIALVLGGNESLGRLRETAIGQHQQSAIDHQHQQADLDQPADAPGVDVRAEVESHVERAKEPAEQRN